MKIIRDEKTQNVIEVIFTDKELESKDSLMNCVVQMEQARYHVNEVSIETSAETNKHASDNQKEAQLDYNRCQCEMAKDYNRRQQQMQYLYQFPGAAQIPDFN